MVNPHLWTYAMNQMWCKPVSFLGETIRPCGVPILWSDTMTVLASHIGFIAFYAFVHHGLPLLLLKGPRAAGKTGAFSCGAPSA